MADFILNEDGYSLILNEDGGALLQEDGGEGGDTYEKAGTGASAFVGSGADVCTFAETGNGISARTAQGADAGTFTETGTGIAPFTASGADEETTNNTKTNVAISAFTASGGDATTYSETGTGVAVFYAEGDGRWEVTESGAATSPFVASGFTLHDYVKAGAAVMERTGTGDGQWTLAQRNKSLSFAGLGWTLGMAHVASGVTDLSISKFGIAKSIFIAYGRQGDAVRGTAIRGHSASLAKGEMVYNKGNVSVWYGSSGVGLNFSVPLFPFGARADVVMTETGFTVRGLAATGDSRITYAETGAGISERTVSGVPGKNGTASTALTGTGSDVLEYVETGTAVAPFVASGEAQPGGAAVAQFSGGGVLKSLYANDNFAAREVIDVPTGDLEADGGPRSWLLTGATGQATTEASENLSVNFGTLSKTLWWELRVPFTCVVELDIALKGLTFSDLNSPVWGQAFRGTTLAGLVPYSNVTFHYGEDQGRGISSNIQFPTNLSGEFPLQTGSQQGAPVLVQMTPTTPLIIQVGRLTSPVNPQYDYTLKVARRDVPDNDQANSATLLEGAGGSLTYDMAGATGEQRWNWTNFEAIQFGPTTTKLAADLFYRISPTEDQVFLYSATYVLSPNNNLLQSAIFEGTDPETWTPVLLSETSTTPYMRTPVALPIPVELEGGKTYTLALMQLDQLTYSSFAAAFTSSTPTLFRASGSLTWQLIDYATNDDFADRIVLSGSLPIVETVADTRGSTAEDDEPEDFWQSSAKGVWYEYTPATSGWYSLTPTAFISGSAPSITVFVSYPTVSFEDFERVFQYYWDAWLYMRAGETYYIRAEPFVAAYDYGEFTLALEAATTCPNDDFADRISITGDAGDVLVDMTGATTERGEPVMYYWIGTPEPSAWYEWTPPYTGDYAFSLGATAYDVMELAVYTGSAVDALTPVARMSGLELPPDMSIHFHAAAGVPHQIQVGIPSGYGYIFGPPRYAPYELSWRPTTLLPNFSKATATSLAIDTEVIAHNGGGEPQSTEISEELATLISDDLGFNEDIRIGRIAWWRIDPIFSGDYTISAAQGGPWQGAFTVLRDVDGVLELAVDGNDNTIITDITFSDTSFPELSDYRLVAGETYYLIVFGYVQPNRVSTAVEGTWDNGLNDSFDWDMIQQGEFVISYSAVNLGDDMQDVGGEDVNEYNLNWHDSYFYEGEEFGPISSPDSGGCLESSNINATAQAGEPAPYPGWPATNSVWYTWMAGAAGTYQFWIEPSGVQPIVDPMMAFYVSNFGGPFTSLQPVLTQSDNFDGLYPRLTTPPLTAFSRYLIQVDGRDEGTYTLHWQRVPVASPPANDDFADAIEIFDETPVSGNTAGATVECGEQPAADIGEGPFGSVWYVYNPTEDGAFFLSVTADDSANNAPTIVDVYQGTSLDDLVNITPADTYSNWNNNFTFGFPVIFTGGTPVYIRVSTESDGWYTTADALADPEGSTFSFTINTQSATPPDNDEPGDATESGGGTTPGTTDGAGLTPGEADPIYGGTIEEDDPSAGTVWHKYVPDADGFVDIYTTRSDETNKRMWYGVGVWEGETPQTSKHVHAPGMDPSQYPYYVQQGEIPCHFEVRANQTYWIQVVRRGYQSWGPYDLHIVEYLEYNDWALGADGFSSTTGSPAVSGDTITCTGNQAIADGNLFSPNYGTIDLGTDTPKWGREVRIYFEVRMIAGQGLSRNMWYGGDHWNNTTAASNDHVSTYTSRLGLVRGRDTSGTHRMATTLAPQTTGENFVQTTTANGNCTSDVSLGIGREHDDGWVPVEVILTAYNGQNYTGTWWTGLNEERPADDTTGQNPYPQWMVQMIVDGKPVDGSTTYTGRQLRYIDFGMFRHPNLFGPGDTGYTDQSYVENPEAWTYEMRRCRVTNKYRDPYTMEFAGSQGVYEFDGFDAGAPWLASGSRHYAVVGTGSFGSPQYGDLPSSAIFPAPDKPGKYAVRGFGTSFRGARYGLASGPTRWYALSARFDAFSNNVNFPTQLSGYTAYNSFSGAQSGAYLASLRVNGAKELRIQPYGRDFCVAHLSEEDWHYIEVHTDCHVMWDVQCTVYIDGVGFGTFSNAQSWSEVVAAGNSFGYVNSYPAEYNNARTLEFYTTFSVINNGVDAYVTNLIAAHGKHEASVGPLQTVSVAAAATDSAHGLPDFPDDYIDIYKTGHYQRLHTFEWDDSEPGPISVSGPAEQGLPVIAPRFWEPCFILDHTPAWSESGSWSPLNEGRTRQPDNNPLSATAGATLTLSRFGNSVPVDDVVTGIEVRVRRRGAGVSDTIQLRKNGSLVGSALSGGAWDSDWEYVTYGGPGNLWGTTWTPNEVNALTFGLDVATSGGGTAELDLVAVKVYFDDEGRPLAVPRGSFLPPGGLFNLGADDVVAAMDYTGDAPGIGWPLGGWEPGGEGGSGNGMAWGSVYTLWLWQARGEKVPFVQLSAGQSTTVSNIRLVRNPKTYPRYAVSGDNGATWDWVLPDTEDSSNYISSDVMTSDTSAVFLDNAAAMDRWQAAPGGWASGLDEDRPSAHPAYRYQHWYVAYEGDDTAEDTIVAVNLQLRWRAYQNYPNTTTAGSSVFYAHISGDGGVRRVGRYTGGGTANGRFTVPLTPGNTVWTPDDFNVVVTRLGMNDRATAGAFSLTNRQDQGAALKAAAWELLVPAPADVPPTPCQQEIDLSMMRMIPGAGDPEQLGSAVHVDLSDVKFAPSVGDPDASGGTGTDLGDVLFFPGASTEEEA